MPKQLTQYEVLIASPSDVMAERDVVDDVIRNWNSSHKTLGISLQSLRWELDAVPELADRTQGVVNRQLVDNADFVIALFSARLGSPTGVSVSGTAEEIERLRSADKHVMVYFSSAPVPREHDPEQLRRLNEYKSQLLKQGLCFEFKDRDELWRKLSHNLAAKMSAIAETTPEAATTPAINHARLVVRPGQLGRSGDVKTVRLEVEIQNLSQTTWIRDFSISIYIPSQCLTFTSSRYMTEMKSETAGIRKFRVLGTAIHPGDKLVVFSIDLGIEQLMMKGTYLEGDINAVLAEKIKVDGIVEGQLFDTEMSVGDIFPDISEPRIMNALEDRTLWKGGRPMTGAGDMAVRADELAEHLSLHVDDVNEVLERLEQKGRVESAGGNLSDPTPRWHTTRKF